jgi:ubiquinone/menaquinone biosynthesis C-methylase UbiE
VAHVDRASGVAAFRDYKQHALALLDPRPGMALLDVGCGTGTDARELAAQVMPGGRVVGLDVSDTMLSEARQRSAGLPIDFVRGDAHKLEFPDGAFDGCRADRVFQHLADPRATLAEMARVTRRGGHIVVTDADWETLVVDIPDRTPMRKVTTYAVDTIHVNGWIGRELPRLFAEAGLTAIGVSAHAAYVTDWEMAEKGARLPARATAARDAGVISDAEAARWIELLEGLRRDGRFWYALTFFTVYGRKPPAP